MNNLGLLRRIQVSDAISWNTFQTGLNLYLTSIDRENSWGASSTLFLEPFLKRLLIDLALVGCQLHVYVAGKNLMLQGVQSHPAH